MEKWFQQTLPCSSPEITDSHFPSEELIISLIRGSFHWTSPLTCTHAHVLAKCIWSAAVSHHTHPPTPVTVPFVTSCSVYKYTAPYVFRSASSDSADGGCAQSYSRERWNVARWCGLWCEQAWQHSCHHGNGKKKKKPWCIMSNNMLHCVLYTYCSSHTENIPLGHRRGCFRAETWCGLAFSLCVFVVFKQHDDVCDVRLSG